MKKGFLAMSLAVAMMLTITVPAMADFYLTDVRVENDQIYISWGDLATLPWQYDIWFWFDGEDGSSYLAAITATGNDHPGYVIFDRNNLTMYGYNGKKIPDGVYSLQVEYLVPPYPILDWPEKLVIGNPEPPAPVLERIEITSYPKTVYTVGDSLNLTGLEVTAHYSDGSSEPATDYTTDPADNTVLNAAGAYKITVYFGEESAFFDITVDAPAPKKDNGNGNSQGNQNGNSQGNQNGNSQGNSKSNQNKQ